MRVMLVPRGESLALPVFGGRLLLLLPKPAGARPRSEVLPCASQVRPEPRFGALPEGRCELLPKPPRAAFASAFVRIVEFGLSSESSRWRPDIPLLPKLPLPAGPRLPCSLPRPVLPEFSKPRPLPVGRPLPPRTEGLSAARTEPELKERVGMCDAPGAGLLRATTERF